MAVETWLGFLVACWVISLSPGAGAIASMSAGLQYGFLRGYWNALGLQLALGLQIAIVAAGVGAVLATSQLAFSLIKWFGVAYLVYLGWRQWRAQPSDITTTEQRPSGRLLALVLRGFLVNFSNPKAIVFILAVIPQFINPQAALFKQYLVIAATMIGVDLVVMAGYTALAAKLLGALRSAKQQRVLNRTFGGLFIVAAGLLTTVRQATG